MELASIVVSRDIARLIAQTHASLLVLVVSVPRKDMQLVNALRNHPLFAETARKKVRFNEFCNDQYTVLIGVKIGHSSMECTNKRVMDTSHIKEREDIEAIWADMTKANEEDDFDAFKEHMLEYIKANPSLRLDELENAFRGEDFNYYLYALEVDVSYDKCLVGPHGEPDAKYIWTLNKTPRPRRSKLIAHRMAKTTEGNLERLKYAGTLEDEIKPFCYACKG